MRNPNITQALTAAREMVVAFDDQELPVASSALANLIADLYVVPSAHLSILEDVIGGQVEPVRAVRAIKAINAAYDTEA